MGKIIFVTGGSGSGKSEFAESLFDEKDNKYYVATMMVFDKEGETRVDRHRKMRDGKMFKTKECPLVLKEAIEEENESVLVECMGNLCLNRLYEDKQPKIAFEKITKDLEFLFGKTEKCVIVSNDVFSDGVDYSKETKEYLKLLSDVNKWICKKSDDIVEVVSSIPIYYKRRV